MTTPSIEAARIRDIGDALTPLDLEARAFDAALRNAFTLSKRWLAAPPVEMKSLVLEIVERVTVAADRIEIRLNRAKIAAALEAGGGSQRPDIDPITLSIEAKLRRGIGHGKLNPGDPILWLPFLNTYRTMSSLRSLILGASWKTFARCS